MSQIDKWKLLEKHANIVFLPLYLYDHSGITMSTGSFGDRWDSGQVGYIYTDKKTIMETGGMLQNEKGNYVKITDKNWKKAAYRWMEGEVKVYDQYLTGEVFAFITPIGEWCEKGEMGWWAVVYNEKEKSDWETEFKEFIDGLDKDTMVTIVDCHI